MQVKFYPLPDQVQPLQDITDPSEKGTAPAIDDEALKFAVILTKYQGKWVFCKHKERSTWEFPGGHRETGESIHDAANRELAEETGACDFTIHPVCIYSVTGRTRVNESGEESFGMLFFAQIHQLESELHSEIEKIALFDEPPADWTYPLIQPLLMQEYLRLLPD